jgi:hypothetical protein
MVSKNFVPFGGVHGWIVDLIVISKSGQAKKSGAATESYYVAEPNERRALVAMQAHVAASRNATLTLRRPLSRQEIAGLQLKRGQVKQQ